MKFLLRFSIILLLAAGSGGLLCAQDANGIYAKVDENPTPLKTPEPKYPKSLSREGINGIVSVTCVIDETGKVTDAKATKTTHVDFVKPALDAILNWKFKPATKDGKPVKVRVVIPFHFNNE